MPAGDSSARTSKTLTMPTNLRAAGSQTGKRESSSRRARSRMPSTGVERSICAIWSRGIMMSRQRVPLIWMTPLIIRVSTGDRAPVSPPSRVRWRNSSRVISGWFSGACRWRPNTSRTNSARLQRSGSRIHDAIHSDRANGSVRWDGKPWNHALGMYSPKMSRTMVASTPAIAAAPGTPQCSAMLAARTATATWQRFVPISVVPSRMSGRRRKSSRMRAPGTRCWTRCRRRSRLTAMTPVSRPAKKALPATQKRIRTSWAPRLMRRPPRGPVSRCARG